METHSWSNDPQFPSHQRKAQQMSAYIMELIPTHYHIKYVKFGNVWDVLYTHQPMCWFTIYANEQRQENTWLSSKLCFHPHTKSTVHSTHKCYIFSGLIWVVQWFTWYPATSIIETICHYGCIFLNQSFFRTLFLQITSPCIIYFCSRTTTT